MLDRNKSMDNLDNSAKRTNKTLERTQELMKNTKGGSRAAAAAFDQSGYDTARGTVGTGAGGRDFAKQSRELDGLVRLYAVYAANIFAAGAAFRALSEAMDTSNMIQGLNQLGAASGVAMGGLAKRFAEASGGAISLRESMEATAKAVSSGLSQTQFLKLGEVAKKASQALGVNMSDAVSRLTRGITKLEPELLDELGIFTKVGQATEDYARAVGKPAAALTDFEKRQAFANAVLAEGAKKFGQIDIPTNPYDKLLATLKNVAQAGLEIVNNVLGPFANLLAKNSGLLVGALALIGAKIVKDALPAIGQWRAGLREAADDARKRSSEIASSFGEKFLERTNAAFKVPDLRADLQTAEAQYKASRVKFAQIDNDYAKQRKGSQFYENLTKGTTSPAAIQREINTLKEAGLSIDSKVIKNLEEQKRQLESVRSLRKQLTAAENAALDKAEGSTGGIGDTLRRMAARNARAGSERANILANVSTATQEEGFLPAIRSMNKELSNSKTLNGLDKFKVRVSGVFIAAANSVGLFMSAISAIAGPVIALVTVLTAVLPFFRKNEEESARFAASLDLVKDSSDNAYRVMERLSKLDPLERLSIDNTHAKAVALEGLSGSMVKAIDDFETELSTRNWADSTLNFLSGLIGRSAEDNLSKQLILGIQRSVDLAGSTSAVEEIKSKVADILTIPKDSTMADLTSSIKASTPAVKKQISKLLEESGKEAVRSTGSFKAFRDGLIESGKVYQDLINTTKNSSPLAKFAESSTKELLDFAKVLDTGDLKDKLAGLSALTTDKNFLQIIPPENAKQILQTSKELQVLADDYADVENKIKIYTDALDQNRTALKYAKNQGVNSDEYKRAADAVQRLNQVLEDTKRSRTDIGPGLERASKVFTTAIKDGLIANIDTFTDGLRDAAARAGLELKKAAVAGINDPRLKASFQRDIDIKTIELDRKLLDVQMNLITSNAELRLAIMDNTLSQNLEKAGIKGTPEEILSQLNKPENKGLLEQKRTVDTFRENKGKTSADLRKMLKEEGLTLGAAQGIGEAVGQAQSREALNAQMEALKGKEKGRLLQGKLEDIDANKAVALENLAKLQKDIDQEQLKFAQKKDSMSEAEVKAAEELFTIRKADLTYASQIIEANSAVLKAQEVSGTLGSTASKQNLDYTLAIFDVTKRQALEERDISTSGSKRTADIAKQVEDKNKELRAAEQLAIENAASIELQLSNNKIAQDQLTFKEQMGLIDSDSFKKQMDSLKVDEAKLDQTKQLTAAQVAYNQEIGKLDLAKLQAGGTYTGAKAAEDEIARKNLLKNFQDQVTGITTVTNARIADAKAIQEVTLRQEAYTDLFKQAFKGMEDAIVNFTKTGKLNFSDMINSFAEGLLRFEIQASQRALFEGLGGAGGMGKSLAGAASSGIDWFTGLFKSAQGSVYDGGLTKFAQGGMFTNSVVSSPTLFKFAQGTGMMGEAGPEAIMPLKRDSNGNLGVRTNQQQQGNVDVVVNNYGNEKATTRETTDSQGNRKIEVMIGEMVSKEVSRTGSSTQQAFSTTFGSRPALARR